MPTLSNGRFDLIIYIVKDMYESVTIAIRFFRTAAGNTPVLDFVAALPEEQQGTFMAMVREIEANGLDHVDHKHIRGKLDELRPDQNRYFYVLYTVMPDNFLCFLHAYKKQSRKAPPHEIELAEKRAEALLEAIEPEQKAAKEKSEKEAKRKK